MSSETINKHTQSLMMLPPPPPPPSVRRATLADLPTMLSMVSAARAAMKAAGLPQWQGDEGPNETALRGDIARGDAYVLLAAPPAAYEHYNETVRHILNCSHVTRTRTRACEEADRDANAKESGSSGRNKSCLYRPVIAAMGTLTSQPEAAYDAAPHLFIPRIPPRTDCLRRSSSGGGGGCTYAAIHRFTVRRDFRVRRGAQTHPHHSNSNVANNNNSGSVPSTTTSKNAHHLYPIQPPHVAAFLMQFLISLAKLHGFQDVRIDTHPLNAAMRRLIASCGFHLRGEVQIPNTDNPERVVYQIDLREGAEGGESRETPSKL